MKFFSHWRNVDCSMPQMIVLHNIALRISSNATFIYYYVFKHYVFQWSRSSSGVDFNREI